MKLQARALAQAGCKNGEARVEAASTDMHHDVADRMMVCKYDVFSTASVKSSTIVRVTILQQRYLLPMILEVPSPVVTPGIVYTRYSYTWCS